MAAGDTGNLCELLIERTREAPGRSAIVDRHGTLTYAELEALTGHLAAGLARAGVSRGDRVAVLLPVSREL
ncbi:MAG TPA: AMP-binding protein, partial [Candidatus Limnocylindria bacterium]